MKQIVNFSQFCDSFSEQYRRNFTYEGKRVLFDYLEELESDLDVEIELDPVALCCEYVEYTSFTEFQKDYPSIDKDDLGDNTQVIPVDGTDPEELDGGFIIQAF